MLLVGIVDFGVVFGAQTQIANAAREGARAGALTGKQPEAQTAANLGISGMPGAAGALVEVECTTLAGSPCLMTDTVSDAGSMVTVKITYVHKWLSPVVLGFSPTITLQAKSQMRIEA